ncbi:MAG: hypothetical protein AB7H77_12685 [Bdellovibrionales bacterium]
MKPALDTRFLPGRFQKIWLSSLFIFPFLFCLFNFNAFGIAEPRWFNSFLSDGESVILGRLAASRHEGLTAYGGLPGHYTETGEQVAPEIPLQIRAYLNGKPAAEWVPYTPQIGLQGMIFGLIDRFLPLREGNFSFLRALTSAFSAAVITGIIVWVGAQIGMAGMLCLLLGLLYSPWLIVCGRNLYLVFGTYFLPMLAACWGFRYLRHNKDARPAKIMLILFAGFVIRFCCGYEYLTTIAMAAWMPVVFYACLDRWSIKRFVRVTLIMACISVAAFCTVYGVHTFILSGVQGQGLWTAFKTILSHAEVRLGTPLLTSQFIDRSLIESSDSLTTGLWPIIGMYLRGYIDGPVISASYFDWPPTFAEATILAVLLGLYPIIKSCKAKTSSPAARRLPALAAALGAGFSATLSWHILSRQHSYIHHHLNFFLWYIPFMLLLWAMAGETAFAAWRRLCARANAPLIWADAPDIIKEGAGKSVRKKPHNPGMKKTKKRITGP